MIRTSHLSLAPWRRGCAVLGAWLWCCTPTDDAADSDGEACEDPLPRTECEAQIFEVRARVLECDESDVVHVPPEFGNSDPLLQASTNADLQVMEGITCLDGDFLLWEFTDSEIQHLSSLRRVTGSVVIAGAPQLTSLQGLGGLVDTGPFHMDYLLTLERLDGLEQVRPASLTLGRIPMLTDASAVGQIRELNELNVDFFFEGGLGAVSDLSFMESLTTVGTLPLTYGAPTPGSMPALECVGELRSRDGLDGPDVDLVSLAGLESVREIGSLRIIGEGWFESLEGLASLERVLDRVEIIHNPSLPYEDAIAFLDGVDTSTAAVTVDYLPGAPPHPGTCPFAGNGYCHANFVDACGDEVHQWPNVDGCPGVCEVGTDCANDSDEPDTDEDECPEE